MSPLAIVYAFDWIKAPLLSNPFEYKMERCAYTVTIDGQSGWDNANPVGDGCQCLQAVKAPGCLALYPRPIPNGALVSGDQRQLITALRVVLLCFLGHSSSSSEKRGLRLNSSAAT